jgi:hypothetical protein
MPMPKMLPINPLKSRSSGGTAGAQVGSAMTTRNVQTEATAFSLQQASRGTRQVLALCELVECGGVLWFGK